MVGSPKPEFVPTRNPFQSQETKQVNTKNGSTAHIINPKETKKTKDLPEAMF